MPSLNPSREQLAAFAEQMPDDAPILMLNLLRYREAADYPPGSTHSPCSGREAYRRYSRTALATTPPRRPSSACSPTPSTAPPPSTARRPWPTRG